MDRQKAAIYKAFTKNPIAIEQAQKFLNNFYKFTEYSNCLKIDIISSYASDFDDHLHEWVGYKLLCSTFNNLRKDLITSDREAYAFEACYQSMRLDKEFNDLVATLNEVLNSIE